VLISFLEKNDIKYSHSLSLSDLTTFKIGGKADLVIYPDSIEKAASLIRFFFQNSIEYFVMGKGSNLLFADEPFTKPIIKTDLLQNKKRDGDRFTFGSGLKMATAANFAAAEGYSGMEFAHGIPGSVGGAVYMNAGAYDGAMQQIVTATKYVDDQGNLCSVEGTEHDFSYRHSYFSHKNLLIVETTVRLSEGSRKEIKAKMADLMQRRREKQPLNLPSAGSTFKRPVGAFAGKLIEDCGLRGYRHGGAAVSEKHCGFVVNVENASFNDVIELIDFVQKTVQEKAGYFLECEVEIISQEKN